MRKREEPIEKTRIVGKKGIENGKFYSQFSFRSCKAAYPKGAEALAVTRWSCVSLSRDSGGRPFLSLPLWPVPWLARLSAASDGAGCCWTSKTQSGLLHSRNLRQGEGGIGRAKKHLCAWWKEGGGWTEPG